MTAKIPKIMFIKGLEKKIIEKNIIYYNTNNKYIITLINNWKVNFFQITLHCMQYNANM